MDGYAAHRELRERPAARDIPAAALTAYAHAGRSRAGDRRRLSATRREAIEPAELVAVVASLAGRT